MDITLALGGGGSKGHAHIGVLRRLEKEGFKIKSIAGTSFGGLVAVLYASGCSPDEIQGLFEAVDQNALYGRHSDDGPALLGFGGIRELLEKALEEKTFSELQIPCAVTAVDIKSGNEIILSEGTLKEAVLATVALPGIFPTQHVNDWELVDGGVLNPVPVTVARMLSPGLPVVAVVLTDPPDAPVRGYSIPTPSILPRRIADWIAKISIARSLDTFLRSVDAGSRAVAYLRLQVDKPDVIIHPPVHHLDMLDEVIVEDVARLGEEAVETVLPELKHAVSWTSRVKRKWFGSN